MIKSLKIALAATAALGGVALSSASASAIPVTGPSVATTTGVHSNVQDVRIVCGPFRCFYRPGPFFYGPRFAYGPRFYYGPRPFYRGYGFYRRRFF